MNFEIFISTNGIFQNIHYYLLHNIFFLDLGEIIFENFIIFENNYNECRIGQGTRVRWETTNSKPPGRIVMMGQSEILSSSHIVFITLFSPSEKRYCAFHQPPPTLCNYAEDKTIFLSQTSNFGLFFFIQF